MGPLCRIIETLPAPLLKSFEKRFNSIALVGGIAFLVVPDITAEVKIRRAEDFAKKAAETQRRQFAANRPVYPQGQAPGSTQPIQGQGDGQPANGNNGADDAWRVTLPGPDAHVDYGL